MSKNLETICFVLFGETGHGKSTLGNAILGAEIFKTNNTMQSVTKQIYGSYGKEKASNIFVIDTPGLNDSDGKDNEYLKEIAIYLKKRNDIKGIVVVLNYSLKKVLQNNAKKSFQMIFRIFKVKLICYHIIIAFTHFYGRKMPKRNEQGELKKKIFNIFKDIFYDMFEQKCPINSLPFFFMDIDSKEGMDSDSKMDLDSMISIIHSKEPINPSIIQVKNNYNVKDELVSSRTIEDIAGVEGDYIIKKIKTYRKTVTRFYDSSIHDSISEELVDEKETKILNISLLEQKKNLEIKNKIEEKMKKQMEEQIEERNKIKKQNEEMLQKFKEELKKSQEKMKQLEEEKKNREKERQKIIQREKERKLREKQQEEERRRIKKEKLEIKRKRIRICNHIKRFSEFKFYENDHSFVYKLNQTWDYGYSSVPSYFDKEIKLELLEKKTIDLNDKAFQTVTGSLSGYLSGKIIIRWILINRHDNENGGEWKRNIKILGTSSYDFSFTSCFWRSLHWTLELYGIILPKDYYENKDLNEYDYY